MRLGASRCAVAGEREPALRRRGLLDLAALDQLGAELSADLETRAKGKCYGGAGLISKVYYQMWLDHIRKRQGNVNLGIPEDRRRVFRMLRRAIEAQHNVPGTDGGSSLWPAYMDLLVECFDKGWLTDESQIDFLRCHVDYDFNAPAKKTILCTTQTTSGSTLGAAGISQIVDTWKSTPGRRR